MYAEHLTVWCVLSRIGMNRPWFFMRTKGQLRSLLSVTFRWLKSFFFQTWRNGCGECFVPTRRRHGLHKCFWVYAIKYLLCISNKWVFIDYLQLHSILIFLFAFVFVIVQILKQNFVITEKRTNFFQLSHSSEINTEINSICSKTRPVECFILYPAIINCQ